MRPESSMMMYRSSRGRVGSDMVMRWGMGCPEGCGMVIWCWDDMVEVEIYSAKGEVRNAGYVLCGYVILCIVALWGCCFVALWLVYDVPFLLLLAHSRWENRWL